MMSRNSDVYSHSLKRGNVAAWGNVAASCLHSETLGMEDHAWATPFVVEFRQITVFVLKDVAPGKPRKIQIIQRPTG